MISNVSFVSPVTDGTDVSVVFDVSFPEALVTVSAARKIVVVNLL